MNWINKLSKRWNVNGTRVIIILIVFACTGFTIMFLKKPLLSIITEGAEENFWYSVLYYVLILPLYNLVLLIYGFVFGQFQWFWEFEKKFFKRIFGRRKKPD